MKYIPGQNRKQMVLFPVSLYDAVDKDNDVRLIDLFVDSLDVASMGLKQTDTKTVARLNCGYLNGIRLSRK